MKRSPFKRASRRTLRPLVLAATLIALIGCGKTETPRLATCSQNSDCAEPNVCALGQCRARCKTSRDCADDQWCITDPESQATACVDRDRPCAKQRDCTAPLACATDYRCRNLCDTDDDCNVLGVSGRVCARDDNDIKFCADPGEETDGSITSAPPPGADTSKGVAPPAGIAAEPSDDVGKAGAGGMTGDGGVNGSEAAAGGLDTGGANGETTGLPPGGGDSTGPDTVTGVPLIPSNGWIAGDTNILMIQGDMFPYADATSSIGMMPTNFNESGDQACITGVAAKVDLKSTPCMTQMFTPPVTDCYGEYWGAAIGMNLNQSRDATTLERGAPEPFDASAIKGFSFVISGTAVPASLRFKVENATGEFCNPAAKPVRPGSNTFLFGDLIKACWAPKAGAATGESAKADLIKIAWQVVTNTSTTVPFDYCVSDIRALL